MTLQAVEPESGKRCAMMMSVYKRYSRRQGLIQAHGRRMPSEALGTDTPQLKYIKIQQNRDLRRCRIFGIALESLHESSEIKKFPCSREETPVTMRCGFAVPRALAQYPQQMRI
jgi:hypothetical protein